VPIATAVMLKISHFLIHYPEKIIAGICNLYFTTTGDSRKDVYLQLVHQINL
jgi:hypothetical protein